MQAPEITPAFAQMEADLKQAQEAAAEGEMADPLLDKQEVISSFETT